MEIGALIEEIESREREMLEKWNRVIPRSEHLNNRWEKAKLLNFEEGANIYDNSYVFGDVNVGKNTWVGPFTILDGTGGLSIGQYCNISAGVQIYTHSSLEWVLTRGTASYKYAKTQIGDCVYIGSQCILDKGIKIGDHSIVAANSYVNKSFPSYSVIAGTPAILIGTIEILKNSEINITYLQK